MARGTKNPTPGETWYICDRCKRESGHFLTGMQPLIDMPMGWSNFLVTSREPLGDSESLQFCADCTDYIVKNLLPITNEGIDD